MPCHDWSNKKPPSSHLEELKLKRDKRSKETRERKRRRLDNQSNKLEEELEEEEPTVENDEEGDVELSDGPKESAGGEVPDIINHVCEACGHQARPVVKTSDLGVLKVYKRPATKTLEVR